MRSETAEYFRGVVAQLDQYPSIRQCASAHELPEATLRYWINKLNKEAAARTVSQLYQSNYSGRAETGLIGDDHRQELLIT